MFVGKKAFSAERRFGLFRSMNVEAKLLCLLAGIWLLSAAGCTTTPGEKNSNGSVDSFSLRSDRYTVYYRSTLKPERAKKKFLESANLVSASRDTEGTSEGADQSSDGNRSSDGTSSDEERESSSSSDGAPGFEEFQDEYGSAEDGEDAEVYDPLEGYNRFMFQVNDRMYIYVLKPLAQGWVFIGPEPVRKAVDRAFTNVFFPIRFVNSLLQAEVEGAGRETGRFLVNSTVGVGGLFDPARHWIGWKPNDEDFGQTLGVWGMGPVFPLTLPLIGPSNLRDALGIVPDGYLNPVSYIEPFGLQVTVRAFHRMNVASLRVLGVYDQQKKEAIDPYTFFRDLYRQNRVSEIAK